MIDLGKRHLLVIGGTGTIGGATATLARERGAKLTATGRGTHEGQAEDVARAIIMTIENPP